VSSKSAIDDCRDAFLRLIGAKLVIMCILNVTPDSFSYGGRLQSLSSALAQAKKLVANCADIIDVGAESTRPGAMPLPLEEAWRRLEPLLAPLVAEVDAPFSVEPIRLKSPAVRSSWECASSTTSGDCKEIRRWPTLWPRPAPPW
jgi:Pterin binding enzyme